MQVTSFDYARDRPGNGGSLAKLATLIKTARAEAQEIGATCLLFDNGDTLQGTPLGDFAARAASEDTHPMIACINTLKYDACGLGNHDFDFGVDRLGQWVEQYDMPVICSNLQTEALPGVRRSHIFVCPSSAPADETPPLRLGVLSVVPDRTGAWNRYHLQSRASFQRPLPVIEREAACLRDQGADIVIVLAHMGLALFDEGETAQNQVQDLAALAGVDVIVGGHTHRRFPGPDHSSVKNADCARGLVFGKPVIQPGSSGSDLGIIDLQLERDASSGWHIAQSEVSLQPVTNATPEDPAILSVCEPAHRETQRFLSQTVTTVTQPINSFFALASPSPLPALLAIAKQHEIAARISGTPHADLPLVAIASAPMTGGFDGPENFLDIAAGNIRRHHVAGMNRFTNHLCAVRATGAQLMDWLERSAVIFNTLLPEKPDQLLVDPKVPGFRYDAAYGLTYEIDLRAPPLFDPIGRRVTGRSGRIRNLCWKGTPVTEDQRFLVATTDHRVTGGGIYQSIDAADIVIQEKASLQEVVLSYLQDNPSDETYRSMRPWSFVAKMNRSAILLTAPEAGAFLDDISHFDPEICGETPDGFLRIRLHL